PSELERLDHSRHALVVDPAAPCLKSGMSGAARRVAFELEAAHAQGSAKARHQAPAGLTEQPVPRRLAPATGAALGQQKRLDAARPPRQRGHHRGQPTARASGSTGTGREYQSASERRAWNTSSPSPSYASRPSARAASTQGVTSGP